MNRGKVVRKYVIKSQIKGQGLNDHNYGKRIAFSQFLSLKSFDMTRTGAENKEKEWRVKSVAKTSFSFFLSPYLRLLLHALIF